MDRFEFVALSLVALVFGEAPLGYDYPKPPSTSFGEIPQGLPRVQQTYDAPDLVPEAKLERLNFKANFQETYNDNVPAVYVTFPIPEVAPEEAVKVAPVKESFQAAQVQQGFQAAPVEQAIQAAPVQQSFQQSFQSAAAQQTQESEENEDYQAIPEQNNYDAAVPATTYESLPVQQAQSFQSASKQAFQAQSFQSSQNFQSAPAQTFQAAPVTQQYTSSGYSGFSQPAQTFQQTSQTFQASPVQTNYESAQSYQEPQVQHNQEQSQNFNYQVSQKGSSNAQTFPKTYTVTVELANGQEVHEGQIEDAIVEMMAKYFSRESSASSSGTFSVPATSYGTPDASIPRVHSVYGTPQFH